MPASKTNPWSQTRTSKVSGTRKGARWQAVAVASNRHITPGTRAKYEKAIREWVASKDGVRLAKISKIGPYLVGQLTTKPRQLKPGTYRTVIVGKKGAKLKIYKLPVGNQPLKKKPAKKKATKKKVAKKTAKKKAAKKKTAKKKTAKAKKNKRKMNLGSIQKLASASYAKKKKSGSKVTWATWRKKVASAYLSGKSIKSIRAGRI